MKLTRIDFEGTKNGQYRNATAIRKKATKKTEAYILVTLMAPNQKEREHWVNAECEEDIFSMADCLQCFLDGYRGSNSEIHDYYNELLKLSDC